MTDVESQHTFSNISANNATMDEPSRLVMALPKKYEYRDSCGDWRRKTMHFTPSWFSVNMGTGIISVLLHILPFQFPGLGIISICIFVLNVLLFLFFLGLSIARYAIWPRIFPTMLYHPAQSLFLGTFPMGFATIINMIVFVCVPAFGDSWAIVAWVFWWIDTVVALIVGIGLPFVMFTKHDHSLAKMNASWLLPVVAPIVAAASGGVVAEVLSPDHARLTIIVSYIVWGAGFPIAFLIMSIYFFRLAINHLPSAEVVASAFIPLGPCGQGSFALLQFSRVIRQLYEKTGSALGESSNVFDSRIVAQAIYGGTIPIALVIWGIGMFWLIQATSTVIKMLFTEGIPFNMGWWGFIFPLGVFTVSTLTVGNELDSLSFKIIGTVMAIILLILWLLISARTAIRAWRGTMFYSPCLGEKGALI